jgi:hypothetical protein
MTTEFILTPGQHLGYQVVNGMYLLTELVEKASKKEIILK